MSGSRSRKPPLRADARHPRKTVGKSTKRRRSARKPVRRGGFIGAFFRWVFRLTIGLIWRGAVVVGLVLLAVTGYYFTTMPSVAALVDGRARGSVELRDRYDQVFAWRGEQFGGHVSAANVSAHLRNAVVATEDKRFYRHFGISPRGIASAIRVNMREGRGPLQGHGGSTITQQVAKLICLGNPFDPGAGMSEAEYEADCRRTTLVRKIKEIPFSMAMEARYSKEDILTIYLNRAYLGAGARGFEAASARYFGKSSKDLNAAKSAMLAGLLVAPSYYAPTRNLERSQERASLVLGLMEDQGYISTGEMLASRDNPAVLSPAAEARAGGYFADWVMDAGPDFLTDETTEDVVIRTTMDPAIQQAAEDALQAVFDTRVKEDSVAQAAIVVMSADGAVRAMVGGRQFRSVTGQFNRAVMAKRQTGSAFKPFVYAAALDLGAREDDAVVDRPLTIDIPGSGKWSPENYDHKFVGRITFTEALAQSRNIPAVKVSEAVGRDNVREVAERFGIVSDLANGPALALGASESSLIEMTGAYAGFLNGGSAVNPYGLIELRLKGDSEPMIGQEGGIQERVISPEAAGQLVYMMSRVIDAGTGTRARLGDRPAAGKTGTTQEARDAWFLGFTADYVTGVWMGNDDNTPLTGVTGGGLPAEIWRETMERVHEGLPISPLPTHRPGPRLVAFDQQLTPLDPPPGEVHRNPARELPRVEERPRQQQRQRDNPIERALNDVLGELFGRGN
ncbi:MAG: PBP1A family penicillin-binding protein [Rhodobacteraceae bacterium]|nr:PBP1A family penicillin-binding protein [Paracoccaceae bacterium]